MPRRNRNAGPLPLKSKRLVVRPASQAPKPAQAAGKR